MVESATMSANPPEIEVPLSQFVKMNILLWNCRGALNVDFKRRIFEMTINHHPSIVVVMEMRVGGDSTLLQILLATLGVCGCYGRRRMLKCLIFQAQSKKFMPLLRCTLLT